MNILTAIVLLSIGACLGCVGYALLVSREISRIRRENYFLKNR